MRVRDALTGIRPRAILTSRGHPTVEVDLETSQGVYRASCPSGASRGIREAAVITDGGSEYNGRGVSSVLLNIKERVVDAMLALECDISNQRAIDDTLLALDGTKNKSSIGGNGIVALSAAFCKAGAGYAGKRVDEFVSELGGFERRIPVPHFNVLNGGAHSGNGMSVQEIMVVYQHRSLERSIEAACVLYESLRDVISDWYGPLYTCVGDEGGFAPPIESLEQGLGLVLEAAKRCGRTDLRIAIDFAANGFAHDGEYLFDGQRYSARELGEHYVNVLERYPQVYSIEDPFEETDYGAWTWLNSEIGDRINVVGDDLTVTNPEMVENAGIRKMCNTLLVKPNQIGTISETLKAVQTARRYGMRIMASHRSGETEDCFISDLAVGIGAEYIKAGAPCRGERVAKYNQLLRLDE